MSTVLNNTAYSRTTRSLTNDLGKTLSDTGVSQTLEMICQDLLMDGGENSEIWDQSHCFGFS